VAESALANRLLRVNPGGAIDVVDWVCCLTSNPATALFFPLGDHMVVVLDLGNWRSGIRHQANVGQLQHNSCYGIV
jgi:hypothetical protein